MAPAPVVIDIDPELLERSAAASRHSAEQAKVHMDGEMACLDASGVPHLLETLTPAGPWAWAIMPQMQEDGSVTIPIATTREAIAECYRVTRERSNVLGFEPLVEIRGAWYTFQEGVSRAYVPATDTTSETETIALFPVTTDTGITGELAWWKMPRELLGVGRRHEAESSDGGALAMRRSALERHDRYLEALRTSDPTGLDEIYDGSVQSAVRDYVHGTGTLIGLAGLEQHRAHHAAFVARFDVEDVLLLERVVQDWYVFAEVRLTAVVRTGPDLGRRIAFHTAEFLVPAADGRFIARIGHGTDLALLTSH